MNATPSPSSERAAVAREPTGEATLAAAPSWDALRDYIGFLRGVLDGVPFGLAVLDSRGNITFHNDELGALLPVPLPPRARSDIGSLVAELAGIVTDPEGFEARVREAVREPHGAPEFEVALRDGGALAVSTSSTSLGDGWSVICFRDATGELRARRELEHRAMHDPLTGLPNRELLMDRVSVALARLGRQGTGLGVLFIDLDGFKQINDVHGHAVGDDLLVSIAARLRREVRDGDTVARYGGDEFVVLCEDLVHLDAAQPLALRLTAAIGQPVSAGERLLAVEASVGVVVEQNPTTSAEELVTRADAEMYRVKQRAR